ncbi:hypothetical protein M3916_002984 [Vibrio parahaemolyticus]|nr:hypothetical protein [Vibrio parahaemolyticus]HCE4591738.1 hypothetical protein [Vibrio parahaemolyticus]HCG5926444.1 hypothetical protein [Vibrio parahaemolyticus]
MEKFFSIKTIGDLESLGTVQEIKGELEAIMPSFIKCEAKTYSELMFVVDWLQEHCIREGQTFTSKRQEYIYYLTGHSNGKERKKKLDVDEDLFMTPEGVSDAKVWRNKILHIIRADLNDSETARLAKLKLDDMFREMTKMEIEDNESLDSNNISGEMLQEGNNE